MVNFSFSLWAIQIHLPDNDCLRRILTTPATWDGTPVGSCYLKRIKGTSLIESEFAMLSKDKQKKSNIFSRVKRCTNKEGMHGKKWSTPTLVIPVTRRISTHSS